MGRRFARLPTRGVPPCRSVQVARRDPRDCPVPASRAGELDLGTDAGSLPRRQSADAWPALPATEVAVIAEAAAMQHAVQPLVSLLSDALMASASPTLDDIAQGL